MTMLAGTIGHTFGVRVDGTSSRRFLRFLSLTGPSAPRVVDCPSGNTYKVSVMGLAFSVIWHDKHSGNWLTAFATPYPAVPLDTPSARGFRGFRRFKGFKGWWWRPSGAIIIHGAEPRRSSADSRQPTADNGYPPANACYPAKVTLKGISIQNTHASMTWFSKSAAGVIVEGAGRKDVSFPIISFEEAYYGELQSL